MDYIAQPWKEWKSTIWNHVKKIQENMCMDLENIMISNMSEKDKYSMKTLYKQ